MKKKLISGVVAISITTPVFAAGTDFGAKVEHLLKAQAFKYFGFVRPISESASIQVDRVPGQNANDLIKLATGLHARILTRQAANKADMFAFWPTEENPTHTIWCNEGSREILSNAKLNPSVQAIELSTGIVTTIVRGMHGCDGIRLTPWGSILATEERSDGGAYEIIDPLNADATIIDRALGTNTDSAHVVKRTALPTMAWEGLTVLETGVVIAGDELRPGTGATDKDGGSMFKFVPETPRFDTGVISDLAQSPLVAGSVYAMQVSCKDNKQQVGQGCEVGNAAWVSVTAANARDDADAAYATGYYRPEDLAKDPMYSGEGVRFCWTNTESESAKSYAEVMCAIDSDPLLADSDTRSVVVNRFVEGDPDFNSFDNLAFQNTTGNLYVIEDHPHGDIFACLPDGADRDIKTDGCVKILSVKDATAEPTGFGFSADGKTAYLSIQHSDDSHCPVGSDCANVDAYPTSDILEISGFRVR